MIPVGSEKQRFKWIWWDIAGGSGRSKDLHRPGEDACRTLCLWCGEGEDNIPLDHSQEPKLHHFWWLSTWWHPNGSLERDQVWHRVLSCAVQTTVQVRLSSISCVLLNKDWCCDIFPEHTWMRQDLLFSYCHFPHNLKKISYTSGLIKFTKQSWNGF